VTLIPHPEIDKHLAPHRPLALHAVPSALQPLSGSRTHGGRLSATAKAVRRRSNTCHRVVLVPPCLDDQRRVAVAVFDPVRRHRRIGRRLPDEVGSGLLVRCAGHLCSIAPRRAIIVTCVTGHRVSGSIVGSPNDAPKSSQRVLALDTAVRVGNPCASYRMSTRADRAEASVVVAVYKPISTGAPQSRIRSVPPVKRRTKRPSDGETSR